MDARAEEFDRALHGSSPRDDAPQPAPEAIGTRFDTAWQRAMTDPLLGRLWNWGAPAAVLGIAIATRTVGLGHPEQIVFDETYYLKDAYTLSQLGYEARWPDDANASFEAGNPGVHFTTGSFIAHPPLGKWIIALGMMAFGADNPFGWRIGMAVMGVLLVALTMLVAWRLFASTALVVLAGGLLAIDGNAIVLSRVSLLDTGIAFFALLGAYFVLLDRGRAQHRLAAWLAGKELELPNRWGPVLWWRPWLLAAALAFGSAAAVKWSGFFFLAVFGLYTVVSDAFLRRQAGVELWAVGAVVRQGPVNFVLLVPLALAVYVASWWGWFASDGGYNRHWIEHEGGTAWTGALAWVPTTLQNWWHYQVGIYNFNSGLTTEHPYMANPLTWLFLVRPTSMHYETLDGGYAEAILDIANPFIWWGCTAALVFVCVRLVQRMRRGLPVTTEAFILTGVAAGYLPWMAYLHRTVFQFYTIAFEPFLVLGLTLALAAIAGSAHDATARRTIGLATVAVFLGIVVATSVFFWPLWNATPVPVEFMQLHYWLGRAWI